MNHTPGPWHLHDMEQAIICTPGGLPIVDTNAQFLDQPERNANASYIVHAVNTYGCLLEIAKEMRDELKRLGVGAITWDRRIEHAEKL